MDEKLSIILFEDRSFESPRLKKNLAQLGFHVILPADPSWSLERIAEAAPGLAVLGPSLDGKTAMECVHGLKIVDPEIPVLIVERGRPGQKDYEDSPFRRVYNLDPAVGLTSLKSSLEFAIKQKEEVALEPDFPILIGQSESMRVIRKKIGKIADKDITVLVTGETGTGKELIARSIHYHSSRREGPLVKINCGPLPDELLESEVFGFQKGAFTDAYKSKPGRLEMAHNGTLFIDEIGDLSLSLQVKLLQIFEEKAFTRLGGTEDKQVDTRAVAATNSDLWKKVQEGTFRKDLYYRLNMARIEAPSLRNRRDDIPILIHYFLNRYCYEFKKEVPVVSKNVMDWLLAYPWPGNVRELENIVRRAIVLRDWEFVFSELKMNALPEVEGPGGGPSPESRNMAGSEVDIKSLIEEAEFSLKKVTKTYVSEAERRAVLVALERTRWNRKRAAEMLDVSYRTLLNRIIDFGLRP